MDYLPDFVFTADMKKDWREWYASPADLRKNKDLKRKLKAFAESHGLTLEQAQDAAYFAGEGRLSPFKLENKFTETIINLTFTLTELPDLKDYDIAREFARKFLGYGKHSKRYSYENKDDIAELVASDLGKKLFMDEKKAEYLVFLAQCWHAHNLEETKFESRSDWNDLDQPSPYATK